MVEDVGTVLDTNVEPTPVNDPAPAPSWKDGMEPARVERLTRFEGADGTLDNGKIVDSYLELETAMGSRVKIPEEGDSEGFGKLYDQLGRPESPDKYEVAKVEGFDLGTDVMAAVKTAAHAEGLNTKQLNGVAAAYMNAFKAEQEKVQQEAAKLNAERWTNLKVEWGESKTKENIELAKRVIRESPELKDIITEEQVESDPIFVAVMSRLQRAAMDDNLVTGSQASDEEYKPEYPDSPGMYADGDSEDAKKARAWFEKRGYKY
jgi:hypothetical protein